METRTAEARAIAAAIGKELSSVPPFELLQLGQGLALPEEEDLSADVSREAFLAKWKLQPPRFLRVIDCEATLEKGEVVLIDWDITNSAPVISSEFLDEEQQASTSYRSEEPGDGIASVAADDVEGTAVAPIDWDTTEAASPAASESADEDQEAEAGTSREDEPSDIASDVVSDAESDEDDNNDGYCALSHTYGMYVYEVFDCACAANCKAKVARADPEKTPCKGMHEDPELQQSVIRDILGMCQLLVQAGEVRYAWHDGVCIAQFNKEEVQHFISHMGWIYANAQSTIIFLHYIGHPMAPIGPGIPPFDLISRWQTRVWTFQEAALSRRRRYCVRTGASLHNCSNLKEFEDTLASWYEEGGINSIEILEEEDFWDLVEDMLEVLTQLIPEGCLSSDDPMKAFKLMKWVNCLSMWISLLRSSCQSFPTIVHALNICSSRESKHEGDRINSILALAGVQNFDAHKDDHVEESTLEFFKRMQDGLALALFTTNRYASASKRKHTWFPTLSMGLMLTPKHTLTREPTFDTEDLEFKIMDDGSLEVNGQLACVAVRFNVVEGGAESSACTHQRRISRDAENRCMNVLAVDLVNDQPYGSFRASVASADSSTSEPIEIGSALLPTVLEWDSRGEMSKSSNSRDENWVKQTWPMVEEWLAAVPRNPQSTADRARHLALPALPEYELWPMPGVEDKRNQAASSTSAQQLPAESTSCDQLMTLTPSSSGATAEYRANMPAACISFNAVIVFPGKVLELDFASSAMSGSRLDNIQASSISAFVVLQGADPDHSKVTKIGCFVGSPALPSILRQDQYADTCTFRNKLVVK